MSPDDNEYNWSEAWSERLSQHGLRANLDKQGVASEQFWDSFYGWKEWQNNNNYPGRLLEHIIEHLKPEDRILDIGAGNGAFSIPMAKVCQGVTAVEPSPGQVTRLTENALRNGVSNLRILPQRWESVRLDEIGQHDVVLAAYSFEMKDIKTALEKMYQASKRYCLFIHSAGHDLTDLIHVMLGVVSGPDYIYLYNVFYQLGYRANVDIFTRNYSIPLDLQMQMFAINPGLNENQQQTLYQYLDTHGRLIQRNGQKWVNRQHKDALIWINKEA